MALYRKKFSHNLPGWDNGSYNVAAMTPEGAINRSEEITASVNAMDAFIEDPRHTQMNGPAHYEHAQHFQIQCDAGQGFENLELLNYDMALSNDMFADALNLPAYPDSGFSSDRHEMENSASPRSSLTDDFEEVFASTNTEQLVNALSLQENFSFQQDTATLQHIQPASTTLEYQHDYQQDTSNSRKRAASESASSDSSRDQSSEGERCDSSNSSPGRRVRWRKDETMDKSLHLTACGTCLKSYSKKSELSRHQTQLKKGCPIVPGAASCTDCGANTHTSADVLKLEREFLGANWRRKTPKIQGEEEDCQNRTDNGAPLKYFCGRARDGPGSPWVDYHIEFINHPKKPQPKYGESVAAAV